LILQNKLYNSINFKSIKAFAFDLDGTVYTGNTIVDGAYDLIHFIKDKGIKVFYFTNSSTRTREQLLHKLANMEIFSSLNEIYTSAYAAAKFAFESAFSNVMCLGTDGLKNELETFGIKITRDPLKAECLIIGLDPEFSYDKLSEIMPFRNRTCPIIACNRDKNFPVEDGKFLPGCGPIVAAVENALGRCIDYVTGKPSPYMLGLLSNDWNINKSEIVVVGDSRESDIEMAKRCGCRSFLISREMDASTDGTIVVKQISDIRQYLSCRI